MSKLLKIENLLLVFYALFFAGSLLALFYFRINEQLAMPFFTGLFGILLFVISDKCAL